MYGELFVIVNSAYNFLVIIVCSRLVDERVKYVKALIFSVASSICSVIDMPIVFSLVFSFLLLLCGFQKRTRLVVKAMYVLLATLLLGGMLTAVQTYATTTISFSFWAVISCLLFGIVVMSSVRKVYTQNLIKRYEYSCEILLPSFSVRCLGFLDTGNQSFEPLTGNPVHFASFSLLEAFPEWQQSFEQWSSANPHDVSMFPTHYKRYLRPIFIDTMNAKQLVMALQCTLVIEDVQLEHQYVVFVRQSFQFRQQVQLVLNATVLRYVEN